MFENAWRLDRDVFFSRAMNGTDWQAVHDAYRRFLPFLGSQDDFLYLLGQLQGELGSSLSEVLLFEAREVQSGPIATVKMPQRIPFGFHGSWVPQKVVT